MAEVSGSAESARRIAVRATLLAIAIEALTVLLRYGFGLESNRDTASTVGVVTMGLRIHHGYVGLVCLLLALAARRRWPRAWSPLVVIGLALVLSDAIHHFLVLWAIEGSPQFDLWYGPR